MTLDVTTTGVCTYRLRPYLQAPTVVTNFQLERYVNKADLMMGLLLKHDLLRDKTWDEFDFLSAISAIDNSEELQVYAGLDAVPCSGKFSARGKEVWDYGKDLFFRKKEI